MKEAKELLGVTQDSLFEELAGIVQRQNDSQSKINTEIFRFQNRQTKVNDEILRFQDEQLKMNAEFQRCKKNADRLELQVIVLKALVIVNGIWLATQWLVLLLWILH